MRKKILLPLIVLAASFMAFLRLTAAGGAYFDDWPEGKSPKYVGEWLTKHFIDSPHDDFASKKPARGITYPEVCTWLGSLRFAKVDNRPDLTADLVERFKPLFRQNKLLVPKADHVDNTVFGSIPLEIYIQTKDKTYYDFGMRYADEQWTTPERIKQKPDSKECKFAADGYSWQTRLWIDDMFMITAVQAQAYRASGDMKYINRTAREMVLYLDKLQQPNGLFYHEPGVPFFWGRGNGWMAAGMAEVLRALPEDNEYRPRIMKEYKNMMKTLKSYQAEDGMWRQLIDDPESWKETSCTGMFAYAMIVGVKKGWLDEAEYGPVARKGWIALVGYINEDGDVREVCEGTNIKNDRDHYMNRKRKIGDMHGQAPVLWCATALLE